MSKIYASGALKMFLEARERGAPIEKLKQLADAAMAEKAALDATRRAATAELLGKFGLDANCEPRPDSKTRD